MSLQKVADMRKLQALAALSILATVPAHPAGRTAAGPAASQASAGIDLRIIVPQLLEMRLLDHPASIEVTASDAAAGELVVTGPRVGLLANDQRGYFLQAQLAAPFSEATIEGLAAPVHVTAEGARVLMPSMVGMARPAPYPVAYHLRLREGTPPGTYRWPIALSIQAP